MFPNLINRSELGEQEIKPNKKTFIGIMQTSDVLGNPDQKMGNVNVFSNGGRLQPGCYTDKNNINQLGYALKCSYDRGLELLRNSYEKDYKSRYLKLWMYFVCIWVLYLEHADVGMSIDKADVQINCQKKFGWKTRENGGVLSKLNFLTKIRPFE